jgi:polysaccharide export outer membrane protein
LLASAAAPGSSPPPRGAAYKIGPLDVLDISVFKVPELSKSVQVADTGTINLPLVGEVPAAGMTAQEMERNLTRRLGAKYLQNPQVTVYVREYQSQRVTVEGAVKAQGIYPLKGRTTLMQIVAVAGGLDAKSDSSVVIVRLRNETRTGARYDLDDIKGGKAADPVLEAGDMVMVGTSKIKEQYENFMKVLPLVGLYTILAH